MAASSPIDDTWSAGTAVTFAGAGTMALSNYVQTAGSKAIAGRSVGATVAEFGTYDRVMGGAGILISGYQAVSASHAGAFA
jgi:hypothetical protein